MIQLEGGQVTVRVVPDSPVVYVVVGSPSPLVPPVGWTFTSRNPDVDSNDETELLGRR